VTTPSIAQDRPDSAAVLDLANGAPNPNPAEYLTFYRDPSRSISIEQIVNQQHLFTPNDNEEIDFGYIRDAIWLRLPLRNSGDSKQVRYLLLETNWMESMRVWIVADGARRQLLEQHQDMPFSSREVPHRNLVTRFELQPRQTATLWINYSSPGTTALPIRLETEISFVQRSQHQVSKSMIFYALMLLFIIVAALSYFPFRFAIFPIYVAYATTVLVYVMHRDGFAFQYLWPSMPNFNAFVSLPLGAALPVFAILFSRQYLTTAVSYPRIDKFLKWCIVLSLLFVPYGLLIDEQGAKQLASIWVFFVTVVLLALGIRSWADRGNRMLFFVAGWFGVVGASLVMILGDLLGWKINRETTLDAIRLAMVFDAVMLGFAMAERVLQIRRERDTALNSLIDSLQSNLDLHSRLNRLEGRYAEALELGRQSGKVLADATHDLRQPLFALRASLSSATRERDSQAIASATRTVLYLEKLVDEYLEQALAAGSVSENKQQQALGVPAHLVLTAIADMFTDDAKARGLRLRVRPSATRIFANPMVITRIVSNFVANAVRYTDDGGVIVGIRSINGAKYITVYDTGPGMSSETLQRVLRRSERGNHDDESGKGLGLDIALSLCEQHGLATIVKSMPGRGSLFAVAVQSN